MNVLHSQEYTVQRYYKVRDELREKFPDQWEEVVSLCRAVPHRIDADAIWHFGKDKPCYSNIKVPIGTRVARDVAASSAFNSWQHISGAAWRITMKRGGRSWKRNDNFELLGDAAISFEATLERGGLKSYLWRLYAIRQLALALANGSLAPSIEELIKRVEQEGALLPEHQQRWTTEFGRRAGRGWGFTTAYHMLTDLGLSVKPDIHLTRSVVRIGLLNPLYEPSLPKERIDGDTQLQHLAAKAAIELSQWITPTASASSPRSALREVDKVLMEWSRQGLIYPLQ